MILYCVISEIEEDLKVRGCKAKRVMSEGSRAGVSVSADPQDPATTIYVVVLFDFAYLLFE